MHLSVMNRLKSIFIGCLSMVCFFCPVAVWAQFTKQTTPIEMFLNKQTTIRVFAASFIGMGDIVASMNIMTHLRQLGFQGTFEVIYSGKKEAAVLFNLPKNVPPIYEDTKNKMRFIYSEEFLKEVSSNSIQPLLLSITGMAKDNACEQILDEDNPDNVLAQKLKDTPICQNPANFFHTNMYFSIDTWPVPSTENSSDSKYYLANETAPHPFDESKSFFVTSSATLADAEQYLTNDQKGQALLAAKPALKILINGIKNNQFDILNAYGWGIRSFYANPSQPKTEYMGNVLNILSAIRYAQLHGPETLSAKPLIIAVFYDYEKEADKIQQLIQNDEWNEFDQFEKPGADIAHQTIKQLKLKEVFFTANIADQKTSSLINNLQPGQILLLSMGPLPKVVFDGLFTYSGSNAWPQIREGGSTLSILLSTGKPHFRCGGDHWEPSLNFTNDPVLHLTLEDFYSYPNGFCHGMRTWEKNQYLYQVMGNLIIDSHNESSSFSRYFQAIKTQAMQPENDRIYQVVNEIIKIQNASSNIR